MAARQALTPAVIFRIAHGQEVRGIDTDEQLKPELPARQLVRELSVQMLEITACGLVRHTQLNAQSLEHAAQLLPRAVGFRGQLIEGLDATLLRVRSVGIGEERDGVHNQAHAVPVIPCQQLRRSQNLMTQPINELIVGVVRPRPVDNERVQLGVPDGRLAEQLPQSLLRVGAVLRQLPDKLVGDVVQHRRLAGVLPIVPDCLPNVLLGLPDNVLHFHVLIALLV